MTASEPGKPPNWRAPHSSNNTGSVGWCLPTTPSSAPTFLRRTLIHAVTVNATRVRLHRLGPVAPVIAGTSTLRFALGRLVNGHASRASSEAGRQLADEMAAELDSQLLSPLRYEIGDRPLVLVPTGVLHALPWVVLPTCRGRPVTVCPSAGLLLKAVSAVGAGAPGPRTLLVAGPGLDHAPAEIDDLSEVYPEADTLVGSDATSQRFAQAAAVADLVHIAAHGSFRDDNPLMSSLRLADGPMTAYDFEGLPSLPRCLVLSACDTGLSAVRPGEELMGLTAVLLGAGNKVLVASVTPARDHTSRSLMVRFHRLLSAGCSPAHALAEAQEGLLNVDTDETYAAAGFVCFGAGLQPVWSESAAGRASAWTVRDVAKASSGAARQAGRAAPATHRRPAAKAQLPADQRRNGSSHPHPAAALAGAAVEHATGRDKGAAGGRGQPVALLRHRDARSGQRLAAHRTMTVRRFAEARLHGASRVPEPRSGGCVPV